MEKLNPIRRLTVIRLETSRMRINYGSITSFADSLLRNLQNSDSGHDLLIALANQNSLAQISRYIRSKLTSREARIVDAHIRLHPDMVEQFVDAIPQESEINDIRWTTGVVEMLAGMGLGALNSGSSAVVTAGYAIGSFAGGAIVNGQVERSEASTLTRRIQREWLLDFAQLHAWRVSEVVNILERFHDNLKVNDGESLHDALRQYIYGSTPMCYVWYQAMQAFQSQEDIDNRVLVLISDGNFTDGDPTVVAASLRREDIWIVTVSLTADRDSPHRALYYKTEPSWDAGTRTLFSLASRVSASRHPISVLASIGWRAPFDGEVALFSSVCSATTLDAFCSLLLSARFGSADALFYIIGRIRFDDYIDNAHLNIRRQPSDQ